jgi:hypothetical protein
MADAAGFSSLLFSRPHSSAAGALGSNVLGADEAVVCSTASIA